MMSGFLLDRVWLVTSLSLFKTLERKVDFTGEYSSENFIRIPSNEFAPFLEHLENVMVGTVEKSSVPLDGVDLWVLIEPWAHGITLSLHHTTYEPDPLTEITLDGVMVKKLHKTVVEFMNVSRGLSYFMYGTYNRF